MSIGNSKTGLTASTQQGQKLIEAVEDLNVSLDLVELITFFNTVQSCYRDSQKKMRWSKEHRESYYYHCMVLSEQLTSILQNVDPCRPLPIITDADIS